MKTVVITAHTLRNGLVAARKELGLGLEARAGQVVSGGEDGLYRVTYQTGDVAEVTVRMGARTSVHEVRQGA